MLKIDIYEYIRLASKHGFYGLMYSVKEVTDSSNIYEYLNKYNIKASIYYHKFYLYKDKDLLSYQLKNLTKYARLAAKLNTKFFILSILPGSNTLNYKENYQFHLESLIETASVLKEYNIVLCLEFIAGYIGNYKYGFISTLKELLGLVQEINMENIKIVLDTYHLYLSKELNNLSFKEIQPLIGLVQLNDVTKNNNTTDDDRRLPMDTGIIDAKSFVKNLNEVNYDGYIMVETCNNSINHLDKDDIFKRIRISLDQLYT